MPEQTEQQDPNLTNSQNNQGAQGETPASWDEWFTAQPESIKVLYQQHTAGLQNTVKATRDERDTLARQIRELSAKAEKGSELERSLAEMQGSLEQANRRADFFAEAGKPEIGCRNSEAAFILASAKNLFTRNGAPDWAAIKAAAPELFGAPSVNAHAGSGTQAPTAKANFNEMIRQAAGRS